MKAVADFLFQNRLISLFICIIVVLFGIYSWTELDIEAYPDIADTEITVITQVFGLPAEEIELQITIPIERELNAVPGAVSRRSWSVPGLSLIQITFDDKIDVYRARQFVTEKLNDVNLPTGVTPTLGPLTTSIGEIYRYILEGPPEVDLSYLREIQDYIVIPKMLQANGVVDMTNFGGLVKQFHLVVDPLRLEKFGILYS